jgi:transcriptional regulator with XRE-family HTH domain
MSSFSAQLCLAMSRKGMSVAQLAKASRVPIDAIRAGQKGERQPRLDHLARLAAALQIATQDLMGTVPPSAVSVAIPPAPVAPLSRIDELHRDILKLQCKDRLTRQDYTTLRFLQDELHALYEAAPAPAIAAE